MFSWVSGRIEVEDILRCARACGRVAIVTLAQPPWVLNSALKYLPGLAPGTKRQLLGQERPENEFFSSISGLRAAISGGFQNF